MCRDHNYIEQVRANMEWFILLIMKLYFLWQSLELEDFATFSRRGIYGMDEEEIVELGRQMQDIHFATR